MPSFISLLHFNPRFWIDFSLRFDLNIVKIWSLIIWVFPGLTKSLSER